MIYVELYRWNEKVAIVTLDSFLKIFGRKVVRRKEAKYGKYETKARFVHQNVTGLRDVWLSSISPFRSTQCPRSYTTWPVFFPLSFEFGKWEPQYEIRGREETDANTFITSFSSVFYPPLINSSSLWQWSPHSSSALGSITSYLHSAPEWQKRPHSISSGFHMPCHTL